MKQLLFILACFSVTVRFVLADCDEIHMSKGPTGASRRNVEVYYRNKEHHRKFILLNKNPYAVQVDLRVGDRRRTQHIDANECDDFLSYGYDTLQILRVTRVH
jgi:hypothetical protein